MLSNASDRAWGREEWGGDRLDVAEGSLWEEKRANRWQYVLGHSRISKFYCGKCVSMSVSVWINKHVLMYNT